MLSTTARGLHITLCHHSVIHFSFIEYCIALANSSRWYKFWSLVSVELVLSTNAL